MIKVENLSTEEQVWFDDAVKPELAVSYCWYNEQHRASEFFAKAQDGYDFSRDVVSGSCTVSMGDWCAMKPQLELPL